MMAVDEPTGQHVATITTDQIQAQVQQTDMSVAEHVGKLMHSVGPNV